MDRDEVVQVDHHVLVVHDEPGAVPDAGQEGAPPQGGRGTHHDEGAEQGPQHAGADTVGRSITGWSLTVMTDALMVGLPRVQFQLVYIRRGAPWWMRAVTLATSPKLLLEAGNEPETSGQHGAASMARCRWRRCRGSWSG